MLSISSRHFFQEEMKIFLSDHILNYNEELEMMTG